MLYSEKVLEHFRNPRNVGEIEDADGVGDVGNPTCGDMMRLTIKVDPETDRLVDVRFQTLGCGAAIATSSIITELVKGKTIAEALEVSNKTVVEQLGGLPPVKMHCSLLAEQGLVAALIDYYRRHPDKQPPPELEEKARRLAKVDPHDVKTEEEETTSVSSEEE
ncbi:MAG: iron-sulfur cluster assembly scaffold protein [Armatimonadetes bacterium]|nr:iron-sulfur cluster assembly scaffold protein [Armatimonadota bacterium]